MTTGKKLGSDAGEILSNPNSTREQKEFAASDSGQLKHNMGN